jgi:hypothetical protein
MNMPELVEDLLAQVTSPVSFMSLSLYVQSLALINGLTGLSDRLSISS